MTPDEIICTTCEDEGAVVAQESFPLLPHRDGVRVASGWSQHCLSLHAERVPWSVDTCPECGRGREVGRL